MADEHDAEPTQQTQPKGRDKDGKPHKPIEIPVPSERDVMDLLEKAAHAPAEATEKPSDAHGTRL
jgi:hypothetical protein